MKRALLFVAAAFCAALTVCQAAEPLRVFIRSGPKTHGPGQHDHPRFLQEWTKLLNERGAKATGKMGFPTAEELENTDVLVMYLAEGGTIAPEDRANLDKFLKRGGGIVTLHDAICGKDPHGFKTIVGGAWEHGYSKWHEGEIGVYFVDTDHPITRGASNFDIKDEIYFDLHMEPGAHVLATSFHSVFVVGPQMWTYEKESSRSFVWLIGHEYESFNQPHVRALLMRGISWAGKRQNVDELCKPEELSSLKYPPGGPVAPEKAVQTLKTHPEFDSSLVAAEDLIEKAISMDWDPQGRLWVAETPEYPGGRTVNRNDDVIAPRGAKRAGEKEDRPAKDRISWLEDTNGDGRMDKKHVFADGLELVTSLVFHKDGVIVAQAPDILWLRDTNGDGKCNMQDERILLYTGFGTFDTHAVINNFRWGHDGWIYSAIGYSAGTPASADGKSFGRVTAGVIRFKPDGSALEQVASGSCNTWGFDIAPDGELFYTTATCGEHFLHIVMPEKTLAKGNVGGVRSSAVLPDHQQVKPLVKHTRPAYVQIDWVGGFTASSGSTIYNGGAWPELYNGSHFSSEPTVSLVHHDVLKTKGVTYTASKEQGREEAEFVAGTDLWYRPIHTRIGPDGALYVIDFYNQAAIHNDTRGPKHGARNAAVRPDRDHHFGRIYRHQHKSAKALDKPAFKTNEDLIKTLSHPNGWARQTAQRLLVERGDRSVVPALQKLVQDGRANMWGRVHALWAAYLISGQHHAETLAAAYTAKDEPVRKAAAQLLRNYPLPASDASSNSKLQAAIKEEIARDGRLRLETLLAISAAEDASPFVDAILKSFPTVSDAWTESAIVSILARDPHASIVAATKLEDPAFGARMVRELANRLVAGQDAAAAAKLVVALSQAPAKSAPLQQAALEAIARTLKEDSVPAWNAELAGALRALLKVNESVTTAALPLVARWDKNSQLTGELTPVIQPLMAKLRDASLANDQRAQVASGLIGLRRLNDQIIPAVLEVLTSPNPQPLQRRVAEALGAAPDERVGQALVAAYPKLAFELRDPVFAQISKRPEWTALLLNSVEKGEIQLAELGPVLLHRLRTHPDAQTAQRSASVIEKIRGPEMKEKDALVKQFAAAVEQKGNFERGRELYTQNCATCHKFKGEGRDVAPDLTGMGAHGPHDLLLHIVDPNRVVEPNFLTFSIETKDDLSYDGIIARENRNVVVLRNATGDYEIRQDDIKSRRSTGLSLMPNGFEALGAEGLRDLITYMSADESKHRILDLSAGFTADSTKGLFITIDNPNDSLMFRRFGLTTVEGIPFDIINPQRTESGKNLILLKGGSGHAKTMPQKVEIPVEAEASRLHFLGGVAGWGFPCCGENKNEGVPVAKVTVHFADSQTKELILKNGVEIADWNGKHDVPGSREAQGLVRSGQVRWFTKELGRSGKIVKLTFESYDNAVAPTFVAVTAESGEPKAETTPASAAPAAAAKDGKKPIRTLIVGGGSSHDFDKWFNKADTETLQREGLASVTYTEDLNSVLGKLPDVDVLYFTSNQPINDPKLRQGLFDFVNAGKGLVLVHAGLWYNQRDWPDYNAQLAGGGSRSHDNYGLFEVQVVNRNHPLTKNVPERFPIKDELYRHRTDPNGANIQILAIGVRPGSEQSYPLLWITHHPKGRIVCLTLGHDGEAHNHPAYQNLLRNAVQWAAGQN